MKKLSIKMKITVWYVLLMLVMTGLVFAFMLGISNNVINQTAMDQLDQTIRESLDYIHLEGDTLQIDDGLSFYRNGVYILVYNADQALQAGQVPLGFEENTAFENGVIQNVDPYLVFDLRVPQGWDSCFWVRGVMNSPAIHQEEVWGLVLAASVIMPVFILLTGLGGYLIVRRAFRPLEQIVSTAEEISETADLSARIPASDSQAEFSRLTTTFNKMVSRLEDSFEAEKQFTADASHELRTPVSVILGACDYSLKYDETPEECRESVAMIQRQAERMSLLIAELLRMTRLDQGTETAHLAPLNLTELVEQICEDFAEEEIQLRLLLEPSVMANVDAVLFTRLLENLLENAMKYGGKEAPVSVSLRRSEQEILLSVQDYGIGIAPEQQEKIFQRFYQVDQSRNAGGGTGLGLAMVDKIAHLHGGRMTVDSTLGLGSIFTLHLPLWKEG